LIPSGIAATAFGFIRNFRQALALRVLEGLFNGNLAIMRTMVSEVVQDKRYELCDQYDNSCPQNSRSAQLIDSFNRYQARAFVLLPISFNMALMLSPLMAGQLADLPGRLPEKFGSVSLLNKYPYAPPAMLNGSILLTSFLTGFFILEEVRISSRRTDHYGVADLWAVFPPK
jgi:MFS family permease